MTPLHKKLLGIIVLVALIAWLVHYGIGNYESFKEVSIENPSLLILIGIIFLISYIPVSAITYYLLVPLGVRLGKKESFGLSIVTGFYNIITPFRGGMAVRAIYLKKKYGFTYTNFLSTLAASYVLTFFIAALLGLIGVLNIYLSKGIINWLIFTIFAGLFLTLLVIIAFSPKIPETKYSWLNNFIKVANGWHMIRHDKKIISIISLMSLLQLLLGALSVFLQFQVFGINIGLSAAIFLASIASLSLLVGITPAGLGITEAIVVFSASTLGITVAESLSAALIGRLVSIVIMFILGPIFSYILIKRNNNEINKLHKK